MPGHEITFAWIDETSQVPEDFKASLHKPLIEVHKSSEVATKGVEQLNLVMRHHWQVPISKDNFYLSTKGDFRELNLSIEDLPRPDYISYKRAIYKGSEKSYNRYLRDSNIKVIELQKYTKKEVVAFIENQNRVSSMYWFTSDSLIRYSDHWGQCRECFWSLDKEEPIEEGVFRFGIIKFEELKVLDLDTFLIGLFNINI